MNQVPSRPLVPEPPAESRAANRDGATASPHNDDAEVLREATNLKKVLRVYVLVNMRVMHTHIFITEHTCIHPGDVHERTYRGFS